MVRLANRAGVLALRTFPPLQISSQCRHRLLDFKQRTLEVLADAGAMASCPQLEAFGQHDMTFLCISSARAGAPRALSLQLCAAIVLAAAAWLGLAACAHARGPEPVSKLAKELQGAVVNISTTQLLSNGPSVPVPRAPDGSPFDELFKDFLDDRGQARRINSLGSGFVIDPSGLIVTNNHVIENADEIIINFAGWQETDRHRGHRGATTRPIWRCCESSRIRRCKPCRSATRPKWRSAIG